MESNSALFLYLRKEETHILNQFYLNLDLKRLYCSDKPTFRRGDNVELTFSFYDDGDEFSINSATRAEVHQITKSKNKLVTECDFVMHNGKRAVRWQVEGVSMVELGYLTLTVMVYENDKVISIQPFNVLILDDYMGGSSSFIELIQELEKLIENMTIDLNNAIKITEKGVPNGVATLDKDGKLPVIQLPKEFEAFLEHIEHTVFEHQVHGLKLDDDGLLMYLDKNDNWQYVGFSDVGDGGASPLNAEIEVENGIAKVTYIGIPTVAQSKWATGDKLTSYFLLNGTTFTGNTFPVSSLGLHTLYYKDSNGVEYVKPFNVTSAMLGKPNVTIVTEDGYVTVTIPSTVNVATKKWAKGSRDIPYFAYNGTTFTGTTFQVTEVGTYTVYVKTVTGVEYVYVFDVTEAMLPIISKPELKVISTSPHVNGSAITNEHSIHVKFRDSHYKITKIKRFNSTSYVDLSTPIDTRVWQNYYTMGSIDFGQSVNRNKEITCGIENEIGERSTVTVFADSNYIYQWTDDESIATLSATWSNTWSPSGSLTLPNSIKGRSIEVIGQEQNVVMLYSKNLTSLTIPSSVKTLHPIFGRSEALNLVNILNPNTEFIAYGDSPPIYAFHETINKVTLKSANNSTTSTFVQDRQGSALYKLAFQAT